MIGGDASLKRSTLFWTSADSVWCVNNRNIRYCFCFKRSAFFLLLPWHGIFSLWCSKGNAFCECPFALHHQQPKKDNRIVDVSPSHGNNSVDALAASFARQFTHCSIKSIDQTDSVATIPMVELELIRLFASIVPDGAIHDAIFTPRLSWLIDWPLNCVAIRSD